MLSDRLFKECADNAARIVMEGGIIAYPTEAVFGIGCDPDAMNALERILALKGRDPQKGMILVADDYDLIAPYVEDPLPEYVNINEAFEAWPGFHTFILPASKKANNILTGGRGTIAARVSEHPFISAICRMTGKPLVSTSANASGREPCRTAQDVRTWLEQSGNGKAVDYVADAATLGFSRPSPIIDLLTRKRVRD